MGKKTFPKFLHNEGTFAQEYIVLLTQKRSLVNSATYHVIFFSKPFIALKDFATYLIVLGTNINGENRNAILGNT